MKTKSILLVVFLLVLVAFAVTSKVVSNSAEAISESVKTVKDERPITQLFQTTCLSSQFSTTLFNVKNPSVDSHRNRIFDSNNPQIISDRVAYTMVLRLLSSHGNDSAKIKRLRGYIEQNLGINDPSDILAVFRLAVDFKQRNKPLDNQVNTIKERYHTLGHPMISQADQQRLDRLKQDKEKVIDDLIADIPRRMSANGKNRLNQNVQERVKSKVRMQ